MQENIMQDLENLIKKIHESNKTLEQIKKITKQDNKWEYLNFGKNYSVASYYFDCEEIPSSLNKEINRLILKTVLNFIKEKETELSENLKELNQEFNSYLK